MESIRNLRDIIGYTPSKYEFKDVFPFINRIVFVLKNIDGLESYDELVKHIDVDNFETMLVLRDTELHDELVKICRQTFKEIRKYPNFDKLTKAQRDYINKDKGEMGKGWQSFLNYLKKHEYL